MTASCITPAERDPRFWRGDDRALAGASLTVPAAVIEELQRRTAAHPQLLSEIETCDLDRLRGGAVAGLADLVGRRLQHGPGFCRLAAGGDLEAAALRLLFLAIGAGLGQPMTQYGRLYAVKDRGADYRNSSAPVSMTSERTGFHTDSSARGVVPDFVALLCERPAVRGGESLVSNALRVRAEFEQQEPHLLRLLQRDYIRDLVTPGLDNGLQDLLANRFPVFGSDDSAAGVTFRYMRYWLERGQERAGAPLGAEQRAALDRLDERLAAPEHVVQFRLARGDMLFVNNRTLAHDRTAFIDDPSCPRLLWRMWVDASGR